MANIVDISEKMPHVVSEVVCLKCLKRWIAVRPDGVWLKDLECPGCGQVGCAINTGQELDLEQAQD